MVLSVTRSVCSAAQELTAEQLEDLLPPCNLGMNCLKQCWIFQSYMQANTIRDQFIRAQTRLIVRHSARAKKI